MYGKIKEIKIKVRRLGGSDGGGQANKEVYRSLFGRGIHDQKMARF